MKISTRGVMCVTLGIESIAVAIMINRAIALDRNPMRYFDDMSLISWISFVQLLLIAYLAWKISSLRPKSSFGKKASPRRFWQIVAAGFLFLAVDEMAQIHENLDKIIHWLLQIEETPLTDSIDDVIVLLYLLIGLKIFYDHRQELQNYRPAFPLFIITFVFGFLSIFFDITTQSKDLLLPIITNSEVSKTTHNWLMVVEEIWKLLAEGILISSFYQCLQTAGKLTKLTSES